MKEPMKYLSFSKFVLFFMGATIILLCPISQAAPARVAGRVVNETHQAGAAGVTVQLLLVAKNARQQKTVATVRTAQDGRFDCGRLNLGTDDLLIARATWQGNIYDQAWVYETSGRLKSMDASVAPDQMKLTVYDATTKPPPLSFQVHHLAINAKEQDLKCIERIVVLNPSRVTFTGEGEQRVSVRLSLPDGARDVKMDPDVDGKLVKTSDGYGVVKSIVPSKQDERNILKNNVVIINYTMKWPLSLPWSRSIDLSRKVNYPTNMFFVVREESDRKLQVNAPQLGKDQVEQVSTREGTQARIVNMMGRPMGNDAALKPGTAISIGVARPLNPLVWVFILFVVALCLLVPLSLVNRRRGPALTGNANAPAETLKSGEPVVEASVYRGTSTHGVGEMTLPDDFNGSDIALSQQARRLIEEIAKLDEARAAGAVEIAEYQSQRAVWKKQLIDLLESQTSISSG